MLYSTLSRSLFLWPELRSVGLPKSGLATVRGVDQKVQGQSDSRYGSAMQTC